LKERSDFSEKFLDFIFYSLRFGCDALTFYSLKRVAIAFL
jgi:hypothetical protein